MATIASLLVNLGMNTGKFDSGAKKARASLGSLATAAVGLSSAIHIAQAAAGGIQSVIGAFENAGKAADELNDLSNKVGASVELLSVLKYGTAQVGVEFDTAAGALGKFTTILGKAAGGGKSQIEAFAAIGLSAEKLNAAGVDKAFASVAEAISQLPGPAEKAAAATAIFGKAGVELIPLLNGGEAGLAAMSKEADALGVSMKKADVEKIASAFDSMDKAAASLNKTLQSLVTFASPTLRLISEAVSDWVADVNDARFGEALAGIATLGLLPLAEAQERIARADEDALYASQNQSDLAESMEAVGKAAEKQAKAVKQLSAAYYAADRGLDRFSAIEEFDSPLERLDVKRFELEDLLASLERDRNAGLVDDESYGLQKSGLEQAMARLAKQRDAAAKDEFGSTLLGQTREAMKTPLQKYQEELTKIQEELGDPFGEEFGVPGKFATEKEYAQLAARKRYLESLPGDNSGDFRSAALERGSSAAFSASFGQKQTDKTLGEIKELEARQVQLMEKLAEAKPAVVKL